MCVLAKFQLLATCSSNDTQKNPFSKLEALYFEKKLWTPLQGSVQVLPDYF